MESSGSNSPSWDAALYQSVCSFVPGHGDSLLKLLDPQPSERILDFGCGTGELTVRIAAEARETIGLDPSPDMIKQARNQYPELDFICCPVEEYHPEQQFDAVFTNAVLHWVSDLSETVSRIRRLLKPGGRFVGEFGANGNVKQVREALHRALKDRGYSPEEWDPWSFPDEKEFRQLLKDSSFQVESLKTIDRPTTLEGGEGLRIWLTTFAQSFFESFGLAQEQTVISEIIDSLRPDYFDGTHWTLEYRRLRFHATRP